MLFKKENKKLDQNLGFSPPLFSQKTLLALILPLIVEQFLAITIGMADTVMVAFVGEVAVSSISLVDSINILLIQIFSALATGGAVVSSQYMGRADKEHACIAAKQLVYAILILSSLIMVFSLFANRMILRAIFGAIGPDVMQGAEIYFFISALSYPFLALYSAGAALYRSMGNSKVTMYTSILMNVINISGNALFIFGFGWSVGGAALASFISRVVSAVIMIILIQNQKNAIHITGLFKPEFNFTMIRRILKIGIPAGLENGVFQIGKLLVQGVVALFGTAAIAANAIAGNISSIANIPGAAIGLGMITVVGQCVGAGDYKQAEGYTKKLLMFVYIANGILNVIIFFFADFFVGVFNLSPEVTATAKEILRYFVVFCTFLWPLSFTLPQSLRAAGDAKYTMTVSMISMWVCRIAFSYILAIYCNMGVLGVWFSMFIDWIARSIFFGYRYIGGKWKKISLI